MDEAYIRCLRHKYVGYAQVTTLQILTHLHDTYGRITPIALKENDQRLHQAYDPSLPFEILVDQVEDAVEFASAGKSPYTPKQIVTAAYNLIHETGACESCCKDWRSLTALEQNWDHFKRFFSKANRDIRESQVLSENQVTARGYQANSANAEFDQALDHESSALEAIANLAVASSEDKQTISVLTATNSRLVQELVSLRAELASCKANRVRGDRRNRFYCWSCGVNSPHDSSRCNKKKDGHKVEATYLNKMGGSTNRYRPVA